jgi:uncharacterized SAM-binding protein YcdF (DUF218 family)
MFLFLSKLLPLLIYPMGLSCFLLLFSIIIFRHRPRLARRSITLALCILFISGNTWISDYFVRSLEWQNIPAKQLPIADAIVVLGGATRPQVPPRPWVDLMEAGDRPLHGARLYLDGKAPYVILSGGRIRWNGAETASESKDMAEIIEAMGVPESAILEDPASLNTYENAVNVKKILEDHDMHQVLLVTSAIHMPRSLLIFRKQGIDVIPAPTDFLVPYRDFEAKIRGRSLPALLLEAIPDSARLERTTRALKEYIGMFIYRLKGWI